VAAETILSPNATQYAARNNCRSITSSKCSPTHTDLPPVGHPEGYTATAIPRSSAAGSVYHVLHPMGWDAFVARRARRIKTGQHPRKTTRKHRHLQTPDLTRSASATLDPEVDNTDPEYFKWTQWIFQTLHLRDQPPNDRANDRITGYPARINIPERAGVPACEFRGQP